MFALKIWGVDESRRKELRMTALPQKPALNSVQRKVWVNDNRHTIPRHLSHWGRVTHICISKLTIIGSDNGLTPGWRHAIIWTNARILLIRTSGTNFSEILSKIHAFSLKKMHLKMASSKWRPFRLGLSVLRMQTIGRVGLYIYEKWYLQYKIIPPCGQAYTLN